MLKYLVSGTQELITAALLLGLLYAYVPTVYGPRGRRVLTIGSLAGLAAAVVMALLKNKTKLITDNGMINACIFSAFILALLLLLALDQKRLRRRAEGRAGLIVPVLAAVLAAIELFYALPDVLATPYTIVLGGQAVISTGFLYRMIGVILGVLLSVLAGLATERVSRRLRPGAAGLLMKLALGVTALQFLGKICQTLYTRRMLSGHTLFVVIKFTSNHADLFIFATLLIAFVAPVVMWALSFRAKEPYDNPAQKRKLRAKWRSIRRWATAAGCSLAAALVILTAVNAYANRPVELSPTEECELRGDKLFIPFEQVDDGHLHRFAYTTENGVAVRFIVIKKPNSTAYGIGLDACDICGETGYYERSGQVVCNRCDVVMNVNTIGFKGGCNPKLIDYSIENGYIIVPTYTLIEHESDFK